MVHGGTLAVESKGVGEQLSGKNMAESLMIGLRARIWALWQTQCTVGCRLFEVSVGYAVYIVDMMHSGTSTVRGECRVEWGWNPHQRQGVGWIPNRHSVVYTCTSL